MPSIEHVCQIYIESFLRIRHCSKPLTDDQEHEFTDLIEAIAEQHVNVGASTCLIFRKDARKSI